MTQMKKTPFNNGAFWDKLNEAIEDRLELEKKINPILDEADRVIKSRSGQQHNQMTMMTSRVTDRSQRSQPVTTRSMSMLRNVDGHAKTMGEKSQTSTSITSTFSLSTRYPATKNRRFMSTPKNSFD